jgi:membrane associated rhomboid family serine protease
MKRPLVTLTLAAAIVAVFAVELVGDGAGICQRFGFVAADPSLVSLLASMFLHANLTHLAGNVVALVLFGAIVERSLGQFRFAVLYALGGIGAAAFHVMANPGSLVPEVGASGPIFAVMAAAAMLYPRLVGFVASFAAFNIWEVLTGTGGTIAVAAHVGGFVVGFVVTTLVFWRRLAEVRGWRPVSRRAQRAIAFEPA